MLLLAADQESEAAGQSRATLSVVVRVVAACGGSTGSTSALAETAQCPAASAPLAVLSEMPQAPSQGESAPATSIEQAGDVRYLTLIY
jgi:hypothetical protein